MSELQPPSLPTIASTRAELQQQGDALRRFADQVVKSGIVLLRNPPADVLRSQSGRPPVALKWDAVNRLSLSEDTVVQLPPLQGRSICVPLYVVKLSSVGVATLLPSGKTLSKLRAPTINAQSSALLSAPGLYQLLNDGEDWFLSSVASSDEAVQFPILTIDEEDTVFGSEHYGKTLVFTHATPSLEIPASGLVANAAAIGWATQGALTFVDTGTVRKSALWGLATTDAYAGFTLKVLGAGEVHLGGQLAEA